MYKKNNNRNGVTLLIVLAMMVMFAMLVTTFMIIVSQHRKNAELYANILTGAPPMGLGGGSRPMASNSIRRGDTLDVAFQRLLTGSTNLDNVIAPHSIVENLFGTPGGVPFGSILDPLFEPDESGKPFALRPNVLAPNAEGKQEYKEYLEHPENNVRMNPDYTAPDHMSMFLAWNDVKSGKLERTIPSFHRPQLVKHWNGDDPDVLTDDFTELRKYVLRPLPTDHPDFTGSNPAANLTSLKKFLIDGPWDVDGDGDGKADGIWLDIGLSARQDSAGKWHKPLVSYYVIDLDGRINVNTFGNLEQTDSPSHASGMGLGIAELSSELLTKDVLEERYGSDNKPGGGSVDAVKLWKNNGINLDAYTKGGIAADWLGLWEMNFNELGNRVMGTSAQMEAIPYLMNPYPGGDNTEDTPFEMGKHLEPFLRSILEVNGTSQERLRELLDPYNPEEPALTLPKLRYSLTTRSNDIPIAAPLYDIVLELFGGDESKADALWNLLPEEIQRETAPDFLRGEKVNLNRLTLLDGTKPYGTPDTPFPNWATHWNPSATDAERKSLLKAKARFAQEIFYLLRVVFREQIKDQTTLESLAQWSVNLVDFIDPDDVMTPFIFSTELTLGGISNADFDNTLFIDKLLTGTLSASDLNGRMLIWGLEKSEVVLTETFAVHNRNVERDGIGFYQKTRPQGSLFVELYRQGNPQRDYSASSLVAPTGKLDLSKRTGNNTGDYIWRLAIGETTKTAASDFKWNDGNSESLKKNALCQLLTPDGGKTAYPQFNQWATGDSTGQYHPDLGVIDRLIWFGQGVPTSGPAAENENRQRSFYDVEGRANPETSEKYVVLPPDTSLVVTPWETPPSTAGISFNLTGKRIMIAGTQNGNAVVNVSEPLEGYAALPGNVSPFDGRLPNTIPAQCGTVACFKTICLQRLADPNREHHPMGNPYLTVDWSMIDLQAINSKDLNNEEGIEKDTSGMYFSSRQWRTASGSSNIWDRTLTADDLEKDKAGLESNAADNIPKHTLDESNYSKPLMHCPWNDAPLMNTGEFMLVPSSAPGRFGIEVHDNGTSQDFFGAKNRFGYYRAASAFSAYLNWKDSDLNMPHLLDFVHVPSRFTGTRTEEGLVYREPGKLNLNTLTEKGWEALQNGRAMFPGYSTLESLRNNLGEPLRSSMSALLGLNMINNDANNPYTALENVMRLSDVTTTKSNVFAVWITVGYFNVKKVDNLTKLTEEYPIHNFDHITNDDVFKAVYPDGYILGAELGLDDGTVRRHRAFYLIDRSNLIDPDKSLNTIDFRRGKELTIDEKQKVIFKETVLE